MDRAAQTPNAEFDGDRVILRLKRGDDSALDAICKHLYRRMLRAALQVTDTLPLAEDAVAIALEKVWRKRDLLPSTWQEASRYILTMASMATLDQIRLKEERLQRTELSESIAATEEADEEPWSEDIEAAMNSVRNELWPHLGKRHFKILREVSDEIQAHPDNMQEIYASVAARHAMSPGAVRNSWSDAGKQLQGVLHRMGWHDFAEDDVRSLLAKLAQAGPPS